MPEYTSTLLLAFILASCFYKKHVRDWWWFRFGVGCYLVSLAFPVLASIIPGATIFTPGNPIDVIVRLLGDAAVVASAGGLIMACVKNAEIDSQHIHCLKCGYILKGLTEPRCPECGERI